MKNEFLSVVSHELRTPLTSIRASLELVEGGALGRPPPQVARMVTVALREQRAADPADQRPARHRADRVRHRPDGAHDARARDLLGAAAAADPRAWPPSPRACAWRSGDAEGRSLADEDQVMQALTNLVGNAVKFSDPARPCGRGGRGPRGRVRPLPGEDQGRGIPPDMLETIFDRFEQVDSSDARQKGGTGLGLTISRGIVPATAAGSGPRASSGSARPSPSPCRPRPGPAPSPTAGAGEPEATVLVCDDDPGVVEALSRGAAQPRLPSLGVTDGPRSSLADRRRAARRVLLDLIMPGTTGARCPARP